MILIITIVEEIHWCRKMLNLWFVLIQTVKKWGINYKASQEIILSSCTHSIISNILLQTYSSEDKIKGTKCKANK